MTLIPMVEALRLTAEARPAEPALTVEGEGSLSWAELDVGTNRLARAFAGLGVVPGDFVTIALPNSLGFVESAVAALKLGAIPQPVSHRLPDRERQTIVELAGSRLVIGAPREAHPGRACLAEVPATGSLDGSPLPVVVSAAWKAPTSGGSTGRPKLIVSGDAALVEDGGDPPLLLPRDGTMLVPGPLYHNAPFACTVLGLFHGSHVVLERRFDAALTLDLVERHRPSFVLLVPTMMHRIWRLPPEVRDGRDLSSLRVAFHMAAPCPPWLKEAWIEWLGPERVFELYGATEQQSLTVISGVEWLRHRGSVGRPITGEMRVLDAAGRPLPPGEVGEIWMRRAQGTDATYRYVGAEPRTLEDGWESVGDLGWMDEDGYVYVADRRTDLILVGGANVYPAEVEAALEEHPAVGSCVVVGLPDDDLGQRPHAIVQAEGVTQEELVAHLEARLVRHKIPRSFEFVGESLRDDAGKVRRAGLRRDRTGPR